MVFSDIYIIVSLVVLEGLLSVDNALVNASLAVLLPKGQQGKAICFGLAAGAALRVVALLLAGLIIRFTWIKLAGAGYLVYLGVKNLFFEQKDRSTPKDSKNHFWGVVISIGFADIAFSFDNVVAAIGMSPKLPVVITGVVAGIIVMMFATEVVAMLVRRYPALASAAYVIVALIGATIFADQLFGITVRETQKFLGIISIVGLTVAYEEIKIWSQRKLRLKKSPHSC